MADKSGIRTRKDLAVDFLQLVVAGKIDEAYKKYIDPHGKHHNVYFPTGFPALKQGMIENHAQFPNKRIMVKNVLGDGDLVAVHSNIAMNAGEPGIAVVHIFRFNEDKIIEMWDIGQAIPDNSSNNDGAF